MNRRRANENGKGNERREKETEREKERARGVSSRGRFISNRRITRAAEHDDMLYVGVNPFHSTISAIAPHPVVGK